MPMDVFGFAEKVKEKAKQTLIQDGTHAPIMFCMTPKKMLVIPLQFETEKEKYDTLTRVKHLMGSMNVWAYILIIKAWMVSGPGIDLSTRPSQSPDRVNILMISAVTHQRKKTWSIPVENMHGIISFGKEIVLDTENKNQQVSGNFMDLLGLIH
jgi:hypothetical protein